MIRPTWKHTIYYTLLKLPRTLIKYCYGLLLPTCLFRNCVHYMSASFCLVTNKKKYMAVNKFLHVILKWINLQMLSRKLWWKCSNLSMCRLIEALQPPDTWPNSEDRSNSSWALIRGPIKSFLSYWLAIPKWMSSSSIFSCFTSVEIRRICK